MLPFERPEAQFATVQEWAHHFRCSEDTVRREIARQHIPAIRIGKRVLIPWHFAEVYARLCERRMLAQQRRSLERRTGAAPVGAGPINA